MPRFLLLIVVCCISKLYFKAVMGISTLLVGVSLYFCNTEIKIHCFLIVFCFIITEFRQV